MRKVVITIVMIISVIANVYAQDLPEMVKVEGGTFRMGNVFDAGQENEKPVHNATLSTFYIAKTETTVLQWKSFCTATGRSLPPAPPQGWNNDEPIANINWHDATAYTNWLSTKTGKKYRIPTEAEWEYAARGGNLASETIYSGDSDAGIVSWNTENSGNRSHAVGKKNANKLGLYDMTGNVWEWTDDMYAEYDSVDVINPKIKGKGVAVVMRGGGFMEPPFYMRVTMRGQATNRDYSFRDLGLRVVCEQ